jgi:hypothetical protein
VSVAVVVGREGSSGEVGHGGGEGRSGQQPGREVSKHRSRPMVGEGVAARGCHLEGKRVEIEGSRRVD